MIRPGSTVTSQSDHLGDEDDPGDQAEQDVHNGNGVGGGEVDPTAVVSQEWSAPGGVGNGWSLITRVPGAG